MTVYCCALFPRPARAPRKLADARASRSSFHAVVGCAGGRRAAAGGTGAGARPRSRGPSTSARKGALTKAARAAGFTGKAKTAIEILAPAGIDAQRLILAGHRAGTPRSSTGCCSAALPSPRSAPARARAATPDRGACRPGRGERGGIRRRPGAGRRCCAATPSRSTARARARRAARRTRRRDGLRKLVVHLRQAGRRRQGVRGPQGRGRRRLPRPRPRQRAGQHAGPGRVRRAHARAAPVPASRSRSWTRTSSKALKMGALLAVGQGSERPSRVVVHAVARRQVQARQAAVLRRQGRVLRHRRHLHEARRPAWRT